MNFTVNNDIFLSHRIIKAERSILISFLRSNIRHFIWRIHYFVGVNMRENKSI